MRARGLNVEILDMPSRSVSTCSGLAVRACTRIFASSAMLVSALGLGACHGLGMDHDSTVWPHVVKSQGKCGFIDKSGSLVISPQFDSAWSFDSSGLAPVAVGNVWGFIDQSGKFVVNPRFEDASGFENSNIAPVKSDGKWGYINKKGYFDIPPRFEYASGFNNSNIAPVKIDGKWGYINKKGEFEIPPQFELALEPHGYLAPVKIGNKWGVIGEDGKYVVNPIFDEFDTFDKKDDKMVFKTRSTSGDYFYHEVDSAGNVIDKNPNFDILETFSLEGKWGVKDPTDGKIVIPARYDGPIYFFGKKNAWIQSGEKYGIINRSGEVILATMLDNVKGYPPSEDGDLSAVSVDRRWGYVDESGKFAITPTFEDARDFDEFDGIFSAVEKNGKYGLINKKGEYIFEPSFDFIGMCLK